MTDNALDKKLEGRLFDLLEVKARIRLGDLVQLRRRSRSRNTSLLQAALDANHLSAELAQEIAMEAGLEGWGGGRPQPARPGPGRAGPPPQRPGRPQPGRPQAVARLGPQGVRAAPQRLGAHPEPSSGRPLQRPEPSSGRPLQRPEPSSGRPPMRPPQSGPPPLPPQVHQASESRPLPPLSAPEQSQVQRARAAAPQQQGAGIEGRSTRPIDEPDAGVFGRIRAGGGRPHHESIDEEAAARANALRRRKGPDPLATTGELPVLNPPMMPSLGQPLDGGFESRATLQMEPLFPVPGQRSPFSDPPPRQAPEWETVHEEALKDTPPSDSAERLHADTIMESASMSTPKGSWQDTSPPQTEGSINEPEDLLYMPDAKDRYLLGRELGRGGMGYVLEAQDLVLDRAVALKLLNQQEDTALRLRFLDEARFTGQLQHPSVPPVYELGHLGDGRIYFAMKRIEGRTLRDVIEDLREGIPEAMRNFGPVRLLNLFSRVCRTIAFAHSRNLIHRDLKPDNIMLGEFGEITVMDWGLAKPIGASGGDEGGGMTSTRAAGRFSTQAGEVTGTPHYMPPEQAAGDIDALGPHSDIYSLGALLYELLTLEPPFDGPSPRAIRHAVRSVPVQAPSDRAPDREIPHALEQLCLHCLRKRPSERPRSAAWLAEQVDHFLEGEQDRARIAAEREKLLDKAEAAAARFFERFEAHRQRRNRVHVLRSRVAPWAPKPERARLWAEEDIEEVARVDSARALSEALAAFHAVLGVDGDHEPTRKALRELYYIAFEMAEEEDDRVQMAHYENLVRAFDDDGAFAAKLKGDGALTIDLPSGINVEMYTYGMFERVLKPMHRQQLLSNVVDPIPMGSYLLKIKGPGLSDVSVPFYVARLEKVRLRLRLFPDQIIGEGFVHIVGGPAKLGGDPHAQLALPAHTEEVGHFFLSRRPVTAGHYREFLEEVYRREGRGAAERRAPRAAPKGPPLWRFERDGRIEIPEEDARGIPWHPNWPVVNVSYEDAEAFCRWASEEYGRDFRLPTEVEWEKAARGADGRLFPWGDAFEPSFCHMGNTFPGAPRRGASGAFEADISPYNVMDMAGGISEWTSSWLGSPSSGQRIIKGGHWASGPVECRAASRFTKTSEQVLPTLGFRLAVDA